MRAFLQTQTVAHAATVDAAGRPCVVPFIYIYEGGAKGCITEG
jgi:nitroimidazol reductase NimA-like FMN-containing flavoprotein (pyridoxamine 5'-phosphate oxidase superfamily)